MVSSAVLLQYLPPFNNDSIVIEDKQDVPDIITEVINAHKYFATDYDGITFFFDQDDVYDTCKMLFDFCKQNIAYEIETEDNQTTKSPAAILEQGYGDCKHYSGFIAGVLSALQRCGRQINWCYRFASYRLFDSTPQHVFVVVKDKGQEIWIDPVLKSFDQRYMPTHVPTDKKVNASSMLHRISGIGLSHDYKGYVPETIPPDMPRSSLPIEDQEAIADDYIDEQITPDLEDKIKMMLFYGLVNEDGTMNESQLATLAETLSAEDFDEIIDGYSEVLNQGTMGSLFGDIWRGFKKVTLAVPRGAYLACVALNIFGLGTKLWKAAFNEDGSYYTPGQQKLRDKWYSLGGDWSVLESAIKKGHNKPKILGQSTETVYYRIGEINQVGAAPAAIAAAAATIIAALAPIIKSILENRKQAGYNISADDLDLTPTKPDMMESLQKYLPVILVIGAAAYFIMNKKRR